MRSPPLLGLVAALLPAPERDAFARRHGVDPLGWSAALGFLELFAGGPLLIADALAFLAPRADRNAQIVWDWLESVDPRTLTLGQTMAATASGPYLWLQWIARPFPLFLALLALTGIARLVAFGVSQDVVGEPGVWLGLRLAQALGRVGGAARTRARFGAERPDRLLREPGGGLTILRWQRDPNWNERVTIEVEGRFYRLVRIEERPDGAFRAWAYLLTEIDPNEIIRALVRWEG
jgi:hypothetical protein